MEVESLEAMLEGGVVGGVLHAVDALLAVALGVNTALELDGDNGGECIDDGDKTGHLGGLVVGLVLDRVHNAVGASMGGVDLLDLLALEEDLPLDLVGEFAVEVVPGGGTLVGVLEAGLNLLVAALELELGGDGVTDNNFNIRY